MGLITEPQAVALFYQRNLALLAARFNVDTARAEEIIASALPNPILSINLSELNSRMFNDRQSGNLPAVSPQIEQLIETAGKRRLRMESSELGTEAAEFDLQDTARVLTNAVRHAFYTLLLAQMNADTARDSLARYQRILEANAIRLKAGDIAETDYTRIEVESLKAQGDVDRAETALNQARADLLLFLGWPGNGLRLKAADAWPEVVLEGEKGDQQRLIEQALQERPDLKAARIRIELSQKNLTLARRLAIPDVTVSAWYARDPGNYFTNTGGIGFSVPLPLFYRQEGEIAKADVNLSNAEIFLRQAEQSVRADVVKALSAWKSADAIAKRFEDSVVGRIRKMRDAQEFAYQRGAAGLLDLLDAERNYKAMMLDYYTALANRSNAWADLLMALGKAARTS
jgi:cobalt-zinc-cadmium efflux system outer membrane protein